MATEIVPTDYHQQDTNYYCGAATAQMVLESIGAGVLDQVGLYADNNSHSTIESGWFSGPDGLTWTMNDRRPPGFSNYFVLFAQATEESISRKIVWTIHHYKVAPMPLVYGWAHWITVHGYNATAEPSSSGDTSYAMSGFYVNNPWPPTPSPAPPPPHSAGEICGSGGARGLADEYITYATWQSTYMTGVPGGYWTGKFLAVCDPEPPSEGHGERLPAPQRLSGEEIIRPQLAAERAEVGMRDHGLYDVKGWGDALPRAQAQEPVLVQRLDRRDSFYYIVPMGADRDEITLQASVDARFGDFQQATLTAQPGPDVLRYLDAERVLGMILPCVHLPDERGQLVVRDGTFCVYPTLVWRPCRESLSPFYPFRMITVGDDRVYIRSDGKIFTELHVDDRGI